MKYRLRLITLILLLFQFNSTVADEQQTCSFATPAFKKMEIHRISIEKDNGEKVRVRPRIADDSDERRAGYQYICPEIIDVTSILFVYSKEVDFQYHMFNVFGALDIGFFSADGILVTVATMYPQVEGDANAEYYTSSEPYKYALEIRPGFFEEHGIEVGKATLRSLF